MDRFFFDDVFLQGFVLDGPLESCNAVNEPLIENRIVNVGIGVEILIEANGTLG